MKKPYLFMGAGFVAVVLVIVFAFPPITSTFNKIVGTSDSLIMASVIYRTDASIRAGIQIIWLDHDLLAFTASTPEEKDTRQSIHILNTASKELTRIPGSHGRLCFDGNTLYAFSSQEKQWYQFVPPTYTDAHPIESIPKGKCDGHIPEVLKGHMWKHVADGYLDFGLMPYNEGRPVDVKKVGLDGSYSDTLFTLPKTILAVVTPIPFQNSHLIYNISMSSEDRADWKATGAHTVWILHDDLRVETIAIPYGPWAEGSGSIEMEKVKQGIVIANRSFENDANPGIAGAYFLRSDGAHEQIASGLVANPTAAPDGCKLAFRFRANFTLPTKSPLVVVDLCR